MIVVDVFPALIALVPPDHETQAQDLNPSEPVPGGLNLDTTRLVIMKNRVMIAKDAPNGPQVVFAEGVDPTSIHKDRDKGYLTTLSGKRIAWKKDVSCGCGSRLRSWRPYKHVGSVADPGPDD